MPQAALCRRKTTPISARKAAPASRPAPLPSTLAPEVTSALASAISPRTMPSRSWVASATSWPMVRSVPDVPVAMRLRLTRARRPTAGALDADLTQRRPRQATGRSRSKTSGMPSASSSRRLQLGDAPVDLVAHAQQRPPRAAAARSEPTRTASLTWSSRSEPAPKASSPTSRDTVKPTPVSMARPGDVAPGELVVEPGPREAGDEPGGAEDADDLADDQTERRRRPRRRRRAPPARPPPMTVTPEAKKAKTGTAMPAEIGRIRCSNRCATSVFRSWVLTTGTDARGLTGTTSPRSTPATVACTPERVHEGPRRERQGQQEPPVGDAALGQRREQPQRHQGQPAAARPGGRRCRRPR